MELESLNEVCSKACKELDIEKLHPSQELCLRYFQSTSERPVEFVRFGVGQGKTLLCFLLSVLQAHSYKSIYVVNQLS